MIIFKEGDIKVQGEDGTLRGLTRNRPCRVHIYYACGHLYKWKGNEEISLGRIVEIMGSDCPYCEKM